MKKATFLLLLLAIVSSGSILAQTKVFFEVRNEQVNGGNYEFDIYMSASAAGTYHSRGQIYMNYNSSYFGSAVVTNGNLSYSHLSLLSGTAGPFGDKYQTINLIDNSPTRFVLTWQTNFRGISPGTLAHNEVLTSMQPLYHVTMAIQNGAASPNLSFASDLMRGQQFMLVAANTETPYDDGFLPVELLDFQAQKETGDAVRLSWMTSQELNNDFFVVEKKRGDGTFQALGNVDGAGTTEELQTYSFTDRSHMADVNYYRLQQVDFDGSAVYSEVVEVRFDPEDLNRFIVYPSPATIYTTVKSRIELDGDYRVVVADMGGKVRNVGTLKKDASEGELRIDLNHYPAGVYFVKMISPLGKSYVNRLVKVTE